jgi:hypothetical protein
MSMIAEVFSDLDTCCVLHRVAPVLTMETPSHCANFRSRRDALTDIALVPWIIKALDFAKANENVGTLT